MKKTICVVTATRAEYGLLKPLIFKLKEDKDIDLKVAVTGMHLSPEFGLTYKEIINDNIEIDEKIEILMSSDTNVGVCKSMAIAMISFSDYFNRIKPDMLIILGDRYEIFSIASVATVLNIPIAHLHGGELTEGAYDDAFRHSITKMSYLHFTSCEEYRKRVIQLGENPNRVFNVGAIGLDNVKNSKLLTLKELEESLNFKLDSPYAVVTFHPETLGDIKVSEQCKNLLEALDYFKNMKFIITKANGDNGGREINKIIDEFSEKNKDRIIAVHSLGSIKYLSALKYSTMVIGNSSSGIIEAPFFKIPTINIGDRQKGRIQGKSIINCISDKNSIINAINMALSEEFKEEIKSIENLYGNGDTSLKILNKLKENLNVNLKKEFYDL